jgi:hypothetical protein
MYDIGAIAVVNREADEKHLKKMGFAFYYHGQYVTVDGPEFRAAFDLTNRASIAQLRTYAETHPLKLPVLVVSIIEEKAKAFA